MDYEEIKEFVRSEVPDWDDDVTSAARFKAFSGQRSDWEHKYVFWKELIVKVARRFGILAVNAAEVKEWFNRGGLTPLCIDHVLSLMYDEGDAIRKVDLRDPTIGPLAQIWGKVRRLLAKPASEPVLQDNLILISPLKDRSSQVIKELSENSWTSSCVITKRRLQEICGGIEEASVILSYLLGRSKVLYLSIRKKELIEGVKISLSSEAVPSITSLDCDILHLIWTTEKLQQQLDLIDQRHSKARSSAIASLKCGNKRIALKHVREMKLESENRAKCALLLTKVEQVLHGIYDAESARKVSDAVNAGARVTKAIMVDADEVERCVGELEEVFHSQKEVEKALESVSFAGIEDEDVEDELSELELLVRKEESSVKKGATVTKNQVEDSTSASLVDALLNLKLSDATKDIPRERVQTSGPSSGKGSSRSPVLDAGSV
ncbi:hypothetical protein MLD38_002990 [Melastoma candidum]|uniref:Uncharacterized protein n=1 Tax=Melastoma candidum TaxID=119954 RepID=A0ACB9S1T4_9MYRT|nr:hypothetical protein MLD38_002990 [Melastoma candidum]